MAGNKNRRGNHHVYVDRNAVLRESNRLPNVSQGIQAAPCVGKEKNGSLERHFKHKLTDCDDCSPMLSAMVLNNDICVLVLESGARDVRSIEFIVKADGNLISGKKKKGAKKLKAGSPIVLLNFIDGTSREYYTPIGGQLLETNMSLTTQPNLLNDQPCGTGFIAVIYPDTELPSLTNGLSKRIANDEEIRSNVCFAHRKGLCKRGDKCKFKHEISEEPVGKKPRREDISSQVDSIIVVISDQTSVQTDSVQLSNDLEIDCS